MKRLFIVLCNISVLSIAVGIVAGIVWGLATWRGWAASTAAMIVFIVAANVLFVSFTASFVVWSKMKSSAAGRSKDDFREKG